MSTKQITNWQSLSTINNALGNIAAVIMAVFAAVVERLSRVEVGLLQRLCRL